MQSSDSTPNILVISNNPFSDIGNNGKTLASFFSQYPSDKLSQLCFSDEVPSRSVCDTFFKISDTDILKSVFKNRKECGNELIQNKKSTISDSSISDFKILKLKTSETFRLMREFVWRSEKWKSRALFDWLQNHPPDIIFFCAGDGGFAYDIVDYIKQNYNAMLVVYITDDYILPRISFSLSWWIRRNLILSKMRKAVTSSHLFFTISEEMRDSYNQLFGVDSFIALNMSESMKIDSIEQKKKERIELIYAGGLHYNRSETLRLLANAIGSYNRCLPNEKKEKKAFLKIYCHQNPDEKLKKYLSIEGASRYMGGLTKEELKLELNNSDIPVHVESFDKKNIASTRLSISTKIPEYLSLGKPILAIGPKEVSSIKYLMGCSATITSKESIRNNVIDFLKKESFQENEYLGGKAREKYLIFHNKERNIDNFYKEIIVAYQKFILTRLMTNQ